MELYIFDRNLNFKGIIDNFTSFRWVRRYYKSGEFELHCALTRENLDLLQKENIIYKKDDLEAGYIEYRNLKQDAEGKEILVVKGKFITGYLDRRIVWGTEMINDRAEKAMRQLVDHNCINPSDVTRKINNLMLGNLNNFNQSINYQVSYTNLADELENISNISNLGHRINLNISNKQLILDIYKGLDRSIHQSVNPMCIFSKEFENVLEQEYVDSLNNYRNLALVGGMGEGADRILTTVGSASGLDRYELFVDQRNLSKTLIVNGFSTTISDADYINLLIGKGNEKLAVTKEVKTFDSKININSNLQYKVNFDLGDVVTCISKKWNLQLDARITEIEEVYEKAGQTINIIFGDNIPTLIDKIKQKL